MGFDWKSAGCKYWIVDIVELFFSFIFINRILIKLSLIRVFGGSVTFGK